MVTYIFNCEIVVFRDHKFISSNSNYRHENLLVFILDLFYWTEWGLNVPEAISQVIFGIIYLSKETISLSAICKMNRTTADGGHQNKLCY